MKTYSIDITGIFPLVEREVSRIAAASYSEEGGSLYDVIKITSRDKQIVEEMIDLRKIQLVKKLRFAKVVATKIQSSEGTTLTEEGKGYNISLSVSDKFDSALVEDVKTLILGCLSKGVSLDWCNKKGVPTTTVTAEEVFQIEDDLVSLLRSPSYLKAPLQPFGPRK